MKKPNTAKTKSGFTIIEVSLVTAFMAMLMIAIATVTTSISALYRKGVTLKAVNSVGRNIVSELTTGINSAPSIDSTSLCTTLIPKLNQGARDECMKNNAYRYIYQTWEDAHTDPVTKATGRIQYAGVLCTGDYSYVWNTYYGQDVGKTLSVLYLDSSGHKQVKKDFKLLRFKDKTYLACSTNVDNSYNYDLANNPELNVTELKNGTPNKISSFRDNFLYSSDIPLSLYELTVFPVSQDSVTLRSYFSGTFILATERGEVNIVRGGDYCNVEEFQGDTASNLLDLGSEFNYCGINKFNFAARTAGSGI